MRNALLITLTLSLLAACTPTAQIAAPVSQPNNATSPTATTNLRAKLVFPASSVKVSAQSFNLKHYVLGAPAFAQEAEAAAEIEVETLTATVDGEAVEVEVTATATDPATGDTVVSVELEDVPDTEGNEVVEVQTEDGTTVLGAVVEVGDVEVDAEVTIDTTTTAVLAVAEAAEVQGSKKIGDLTAEELAELALDPAVLNLKASLRSILRKDGTLKANKGRKLFQAAEVQAETQQAAIAVSAKLKGKGRPAPESSPAAESETASTDTAAATQPGKGKGQGKKL